MPFPLQMDPLGWVVVGLIAGVLSSVVVPGRNARGCLPNILVGILGGILGGALARELGFQRAYGFLAALVLAFLGAVIIRYLIEALDRR